MALVQIVRAIRQGSLKTYAVDLRFTTQNGKTITIADYPVSPMERDQLNAGKTIPVQYLPDNPDVFRFDMVRIPFFIYLSPEYRAAFPRRTETLAARREAYFTNDMMYDTVCGLLGAPSNRYDPRQDFSSPSYGFTRETLTTMLGTHALTEDVEPPVYAAGVPAESDAQTK